MRAGAVDADPGFLLDLQLLLRDTVADLGPAAPPYLAQLIERGGHGFRPRLLEEAALARSSRSQRGLVLRLAACVETLHVASLIHDDYVDGATSRRGIPTPRRTVGDEQTLLLGTRAAVAAARIAHDEHPDLGYYFAVCAESLAAGQLADVQRSVDATVDLATYLDVLRAKTGSLMALSVLFGARVAGPIEVEHMRRLVLLGQDIGIVFQVNDDLEDLEGVPADKPRGLDSMNGLPLDCIRMEDGRPATPPSLREVGSRLLDRVKARWEHDLGSPASTHGVLADLAERLRRTG